MFLHYFISLSLGKEKNHRYKSYFFLVLFFSSKVNFQDNSFVAFETSLRRAMLMTILVQYALPAAAID